MIQPEYNKNLKLEISKSSRGIFFKVPNRNIYKWGDSLPPSFLQTREYPHSCTSTSFLEKCETIVIRESNQPWDKNSCKIKRCHVGYRAKEDARLHLKLWRKASSLPCILPLPGIWRHLSFMVKRLHPQILVWLFLEVSSVITILHSTSSFIIPKNHEHRVMHSRLVRQV